jgi:hypothetical protein
MVAIRPEDVVLHRADAAHAAGPNLLEGGVEIGLFTGVSVEYHVRVEGQIIQSRVSSRIDFSRGDRIVVELPAGSIRVFSMAGGTPAAAGAGRDSGQEA